MKQELLEYIQHYESVLMRARQNLKQSPQFAGFHRDVISKCEKKLKLLKVHFMLLD